LLGRSLAFIGDPTLFDAMIDGARELGMEVAYLAASARRPVFGCELDEDLHGALPPVTFAAPRTTIARHLLQLEAQLDLIIGGSHTPIRDDQRERGPWLEFGFPSFRGWAWFVQAMCNAIMARPRDR
jgi:hypothetical protein